MKNISYILVINILFFSCSSLKNNNYKILKSYLNDKNRINKLEKVFNSNYKKNIDINYIDTQIIVPIYMNFRRYTFKNNNENPNLVSILINCKEEFVLNENELNNIETQISNFDKNYIWDSNKLTFNNYKVLNINSDEILSNDYRVIYQFSKPIMNLDKNYSIFYVNSFVNKYTLFRGYVIMKKNNKRWCFLGELCENRIID